MAEIVCSLPLQTKSHLRTLMPVSPLEYQSQAIICEVWRSTHFADSVIKATKLCQSYLLISIYVDIGTKPSFPEIDSPFCSAKRTTRLLLFCIKNVGNDTPTIEHIILSELVREVLGKPFVMVGSNN